MEELVSMVSMILGIVAMTLAMLTYNEDDIEEKTCDIGKNGEHEVGSNGSHELFIDATIKEVA